MPVTIKALRTQLSDGSKYYPIYLGYLSASELESIADVPRFEKASSNAEIARNILGTPIKDWQRPLIPEKISAIKETYSKPNEVMPNPVLLAVHDPSHVTVRQQKLLGGQLTEIYEIQVNALPGAPKPLWILDGQHRVMGLAASSQKANPVPLVLLYGEAALAYSPQQFAKVFAEVTTYATPLDEIHANWLQYAFTLGKYAPQPGGSPTHEWSAMTAVARLCDLQNVGSTKDANPFHDKIQFNPERPPVPAIGGGFVYTSLTLRDLILRYYYDKPGASLSPETLAEQIALATLALSTVCTTTPNDSAFFGDAAHRHQIIQDAFLVGVCTYLLNHKVPTEWRTVLEDLKFNTAIWDFTSWVVSTGGNYGNTSRIVAYEVFQKAFAELALPPGAEIPTWLQGDGASVTLKVSELLSSGRPKSKTAREVTLPISRVVPLNIGPARHLKYTGKSINIGKLRIIDEKNAFGTEYTLATLKKGVRLPEKPGSVTLLVGAEFYGGSEDKVRVNVTWT
jgi:DGQHR domain-containing protein